MRTDHRPLDEQPVDAAGIVDRVGQAAPRFEIECQRAGPEMDVEIEQRRRLRSSSTAKCHASDVASVEAPTPPRVPMIAVEWWCLAPSPSVTLGSGEDCLSAGERITQAVGAKAA